MVQCLGSFREDSYQSAGQNLLGVIVNYDIDGAASTPDWTTRRHTAYIECKLTESVQGLQVMVLVYSARPIVVPK